MCGICGFNWDDKNLIKDMAYSIRSRGPDQEGYFTDKDVSIGHKRLSIIDLSEKGRQPMFNEDGTICITFSGEIYNFRELRPDLEGKGHKFNSNTDTEVIIHAYEEYGEDCLKLFNGMFAFAIWDSKKKKLFIARDRFGQRSVYYYFKDGKFLFASEIKALLQYDGIKREFDNSTLNKFITWGYAIDGSTFFKNIYELQPGHCMTYDKNSSSLQVKKYWDLQDKLKTNEIRDESYYIARLRNLLIKSVNEILVSDVPIGASLSGGLDSSLIVGIMNHLKKESIRTYTIGFENNYNEFPYAKKVAEHCNTDHHEILLSYDKMTKSMPAILWSLEIPWARPAQSAIYHLLKEIKKQVTVNIVGEGSDELFAGYNRYQVYAPVPDYSSFNINDESNNKMLSDFKKYEKMDLKEKISLISSGYFNDREEREAIFTSEALKENPEEIMDNSFGKILRQADKSNHLNAALCFEGKTSLPGVQLIKLDKLSMASSLEVRAPFLDHRVGEFSIEIPPILKWNGLNKKFILQKIATEFIPKEIALRKKLPLQVPLVDYYRNDFMDVIRNLLDEKTLAKRDYLKKEHIAKLLANFKESNGIISAKTNSPTEDNSLRQLLFLTNLELMQRMFFENDNLRNPSMDMNNYLS